jgi:hypothetical protein
MCVRCASLEDEVAYLRERLAERLDADLVRILAKTFGLTVGQARVVAFLFRARTLVPLFDLEDACRGDHAAEHSYSGNLISAFVYQIRRKAGRGFVVTYRGAGMGLSDEARRLIAEAVRADTEARTAVIPAPVPREKWQRQWSDGDVALLRLYRDQGLTYPKIAKKFGVTRSAIGGVITRRITHARDGVSR